MKIYPTPGIGREGGLAGLEAVLDNREIQTQLDANRLIRVLYVAIKNQAEIGDPYGLHGAESSE